MQKLTPRDIGQVYVDCHPRTLIANGDNTANLEALRLLFIDHVKKTSDKPQARVYFQNLHLLYNHINSRQEVAAITDDMLIGILTELLPHKTESGISKWAGVIGDFFDFCVDMGIRPDNPMVSVMERSADAIEQAMEARRAAKKEYHRSRAKRRIEEKNR